MVDQIRLIYLFSMVYNTSDREINELLKAASLSSLKLEEVQNIRNLRIKTQEV